VPCVRPQLIFHRDLLGWANGQVLKINSADSGGQAYPSRARK
jgi:hypothetical protein